MVVAEDAEHRGAEEKGDVAPLLKLKKKFVYILRQGTAAPLRVLVRHDDALSRSRSFERRFQPGASAARDQHVAMRMAVLVAIGIGQLRRAAEAGGGADGGLVELLPERSRPHERLVVEAGGNDGREHIRHRAQIELERRPVVLRFRDQAFAQLHHGGARVRIHSSALAAQRHQRIRLLRSVRQHPARAVVLERASEQDAPVGEQRRSERVAGVAGQRLAVEREAQAACFDRDSFRPASRSGFLSNLVRLLEAVADRVAHGVEPALAAVDMQPALGVQALGVIAEEQEARPAVVGELRRIRRRARYAPRRRRGTRFPDARRSTGTE